MTTPRDTDTALVTNAGQERMRPSCADYDLPRRKPTSKPKGKK